MATGWSAVAARDYQALGKVSGDFEDMGAMLYAAEASAEAAVLLRRAGQPRDAAAAEQKARLLARCEGAATPSVQIITARVRLTPGELDAAMQAAAGRSNKQIASDMQLSVRTVEKPPATRLRQTRGLRPPRAGRCAAGAANRLTGERSADPVGRGARCTAGSARRPPRSQQ
jgi:hypothetical protein